HELRSRPVEDAIEKAGGVLVAAVARRINKSSSLDVVANQLLLFHDAKEGLDGVIREVWIAVGEPPVYGTDAAHPFFPEDFQDFQFSRRWRRQVFHGLVSITEELKPKSLGIRRPPSVRVKRQLQNPSCARSGAE